MGWSISSLPWLFMKFGFSLTPCMSIILAQNTLVQAVANVTLEILSTPPQFQSISSSLFLKLTIKVA